MVESFLLVNSYNGLNESYLNSSNATPLKAVQIVTDEYPNAITPPKSRSELTKGPFSNFLKVSGESPKQDCNKSTYNIKKLISAIKKYQKNLNVLEKVWSQWKKPKNKRRAILTMSIDSIFHTPPKKDCNDVSNITFNSGFFPSLLMTENSENRSFKWNKGNSAIRKLKYAISSSEVRYYYKKKRTFVKYKRLVFDPRYVVIKKPIAKIRILAMKNCFKLFAKCYFKQFYKFKNSYLKHCYYGIINSSSICLYIKSRDQYIKFITKKFIGLLNNICEHQICRCYWHILQISNIEKYEEKCEKFIKEGKSRVLKSSIIHWISNSKELMSKRIFISADKFCAVIQKLQRIRLRKYFIRIITRNFKSLRSILNNFDKKSFLCLSYTFSHWKFYCAIKLQSIKYKHLGALKISNTLFSIRLKVLSSVYFIFKPASVKATSKSIMQKEKWILLGKFMCFILGFLIFISYFVFDTNKNGDKRQEIVN
ncbi:hypothetical protein SteCoe_20415 [Stentor coeruleus]|uniref:Uncharacterized protein n=1 Tax=Stentor coeruleus TaxID=5963 RepID=A0A1R2BRX9_9CILI|nr:hypothetical protein SteCoe_20415 [Stentor coeruleus]